jgi:uncharacterized protein YbgA (DUF1722 family)
MRVWDVSPGYLSRESLLGEHREIHALLVVLGEGKRGYARRPETRRWRGHEEALAVRHRLVAAEMVLRGYRDRTPAPAQADRPSWPFTFVDPPGRQFEILAGKYAGKRRGRIPLPGSAQQLWAQHKYSVMARSQEAYRRMGRSLSGPVDPAAFDSLAEELVAVLRTAPTEGGVRNAAAHVWGHVSALAASSDGRKVQGLLESAPLQVLDLAFRLADEHAVEYLLHSTIFSDLPGITRTAGE